MVSEEGVDRVIDPRQEWRTPDDFYDACVREFTAGRGFHVDLAATQANARAARYLGPDNSDPKYRDALADGVPFLGPFERRAWCNPGFKKMDPWISKAAEEMVTVRRARIGSPDEWVICVLGLVSVSADWFRVAVEECAEIRLLSPRVQFRPASDDIPMSSNPRENALYVFRPARPVGGVVISRWQWSPGAKTPRRKGGE